MKRLKATAGAMIGYSASGLRAIVIDASLLRMQVSQERSDACWQAKIHDSWPLENEMPIVAGDQVGR